MERSLALRNIVGAFAAGLILAGTAAQADDGPFVGRWRWNEKQSALPPGEAAPAEMIAEISRADAAHVRWSVIVTDAQGKKDVESFDAPANGEFYPISNGTVAAFHLDGPALDATFKGPAGETDSLSCTVSTARDRMTCKGTMSESDGKAASYLDVFDRK